VLLELLASFREPVIPTYVFSLFKDGKTMSEMCVSVASVAAGEGSCLNLYTLVRGRVRRFVRGRHSTCVPAWPCACTAVYRALC
jgi:hypothetical protein